MIVKLERPERSEGLFEGCTDTTLFSCLQGVMGEVYGDDAERPEAARAVLGDFSFFGGKPTEGLLRLFEDLEFHILVPGSEGWERLIEACLSAKVKRVLRYGIKKEPEVFDRDKLRAAVENLPEGYELQEMDEGLFLRCREIPWCRDWVALYRDYAHYREHGLGAVILRDGQPVSGASSYSGYLGGIEIEIDTRADYRRRGLAYVCGAKLILDCLERGWYPSWDAQNLWSVALAEKLGYHFDHEYVVYEWNGQS